MKFSFEISDIYHATFDPATEVEVAMRLVPDTNSAESVMIERLNEYHRWVALCIISLMLNALAISIKQGKKSNFKAISCCPCLCEAILTIFLHRNIDGVLSCYKKIVKKINADQPKTDVFSQGKYCLRWTQWPTVYTSATMRTHFCLARSVHAFSIGQRLSCKYSYCFSGRFGV